MRPWFLETVAADYLEREGPDLLDRWERHQAFWEARMAAGLWGLADHVEGSTRELVFDWPRVAPQLAVPACDFGIVAGGKGDDTGYSTLLAGDDDAVVCVDETRLPGARDFLLLPVHHAAMMRDPAVQRATVSFLETGRFPAPIPQAAR